MADIRPTITVCPSWARSMVSNFKRMYRDQYGCDTTLSDDQIFTICETINDDADPEAGDRARVEVMKEWEEGS